MGDVNIMRLLDVCNMIPATTAKNGSLPILSKVLKDPSPAVHDWRKDAIDIF